MNLKSILSGQTPTSATIVPDSLRQNYTPQGFHSNSSSLTKVIIIAGEPRKYSLTYDFIYTTMAFLEQQHCQVELRDLYNLNFDPVLRPAEFYYVKDGQGPVPDYLQQEQRLIAQAPQILFLLILIGTMRPSVLSKATWKKSSPMVLLIAAVHRAWKVY